MGDSFITVIAIVIAAILMFIFPLMSVSERNDDIAQLVAETAVVEFIDEARTTGKITKENYSRLIDTLASTGNAYEIELEVKKLDENPGKKSTEIATEKIGKNLYYSEYKTQIEPQIYTDKGYLLKEGDIVSASLKNINRTNAQMYRSAFYHVDGTQSYQVAAQHSGVVMADGH